MKKQIEMDKLEELGNKEIIKVVREITTKSKEILEMGQEMSWRGEARDIYYELLNKRINEIEKSMVVIGKLGIYATNSANKYANLNKNLLKEWEEELEKDGVKNIWDIM